MDPPTTVHHVSARDVTIPSTFPGSNIRRSAAGKRKWAKGKGKPDIKKQQAIEENLRSLMVKLKPIPFKPCKIPDFHKHEKLLKKLGLWDFVHIDLDTNIRVDLVAQLIASYEPKHRASKVQDYRISVTRADFARAFKILVRNEGNNFSGGAVDVDLECEAFSDDSIGFVRVLVEEWVLLHGDDDTWMMPIEVAVWYKMINDGHPDKVDWGSLFWFMVEKELKQGGQLRDCYYASHLQYLIKFQRKEFFFNIKNEVFEDINAPNEECVCLVEGPSTKLMLGQDNKEEREAQEQEEVVLNGQNKGGEHFMQRRSSGNAEVFESFEEEMDEDGDVNKFHVFPSDNPLEVEEDGFTTFEVGVDGFTGNLLPAREKNQIDFDHHHLQDDQLCNQSSIDIGLIPSFFKSAGKRAIEHDSNDNNKKLRINDTWVHNNNNNNEDNKQLDFGMCLEQMQKKDGEINRLQRELYLTESVLEGYRKALKETQRAFSEYKEKSRVEDKADA